MSTWALLLLASLPTEAPETSPSFVVRLVVVGRAEASALAVVIAGKARETWQADAVVEAGAAGERAANSSGSGLASDPDAAGQSADSAAPRAARFEVRLTWREPALIEVRVFEAARELSAREIAADEPGAARLMVWLVVRASIDRALLEATSPAREASVAALPASAEAPAAALAEAPIEIAALLDPVEPSRDLRVGLLMHGAWGWPRFVGLGPAVQLTYQVERGWAGLEAGYLLTPMVATGNGAAAVALHELRLSALLGLALAPDSRWSVGLIGTGAYEHATTQSRAASGVGLDAGAFVQARWPLEGVGASAIARWSLLGRPLRHRYLVDGGRLREGPVATNLALGVSWP